MAAIVKTEEDVDIQKMENQREKLIELIESQFGLLEKLLKMHAITRNQLEQIQCEQTRVKINKMTLDYIFQENKHKDLITALSESSQSHVVNWIKNGGEYGEEFGLDWPLTERQQEILDANLEELINIIYNCELISMLYSGQVINKRQRDVLHSKTTDHEKNEELLRMVRRLSQRSFQTLINCLKKSNQKHIADILENGGALVRVHATLETDRLDETETQIANEVTNFLLQRNVSAEQANRVLSAAQLNIIAVRRGQSIVLYICCRKENEFNDLCKMIDNSEMKKFLEELFVALTYNINLKVLSVKIYESDISKAREMLRRMKELKNKGTEDDSSFTSKEDSTSSSKFGRWFKNTFILGRSNDSIRKIDNVQYADNDSSISQEPPSQPHKVKDSIDRHYAFLVDRMFPDFVLLKTLHEDRCITRKQISAIKKKETARKINELIIKYLIENQRAEKLFEALDKSDQKHLVKYLENDGEYMETFGGDWPITNKETLIIQSNHEAFVDLIEIDDLIGLLYQTGVINKQRRDFVLSQFKPFEKNEALLEILKRCSLNSYWQMIRCLRHSKQCRIADILEKGGVVVRIDSKLKHINHLKTKETSAHIVTLINNIYNEIHGVKYERPLNELLQLKLIGAKQRQDVSLYFLCNQSEEVDRLEEMAKDGRLKEFAESFFNQLKIIQEEIKVTLKWTPDIFTRSRALIQAIRVEEHISQWTPTSINSIPLEVIDVIIQKSFAIFIRMKSQTDDGKFLDGFKQLAEVNVCWFKRVTKRRFKKYYWSYLSGIYERRNSVSTFSKNNRQFIEENVFQIITGTNRLKNQGLLSDIECAIIARKSSIVKKTESSNKATDIALILNYKNETNLNLFREYFGVRHWIFEAMRNCGTSVRIEINSQSPIEDKQITRFFEDSGSESLWAMEDRDFVRWIWCESSDLKGLQQSKNLRHPFSHLLEESPQRINETRINLDIDQLKKKAVVLPHIFGESLETIDEQRGAVGVTKLRNEFYFLNEDGKVKVFCDRYPFVLLRKFQLKEIKRANDIVSCEKENALYILGIHSNHYVYVWKIEQNSKTNQNEIKWLELPDDFQPETLSMSKSDQLLMVSRKPSPSLRIYEPDAKLCLFISLHQFIEWPIHAAETSTGNFVILHFQEKEDEEKAEWTITILSGDGKTIVRNYQPENKEQRLNGFYANYLSIDSNDRVFVADSYNGRVILLDSNLRWNQILFPKSEGKDEDSEKKSPLYPRRLYYDEEKKQLVVCTLGGVEIVFLNKF